MKYKASNNKSIQIGENIMDMCCNDKELREQCMYTWYTETDILNFEEVALVIDGDDLYPEVELLKLANETITKIEKYIKNSKKYLREFFQSNDSEKYYLTEIYFGEITFLEGHATKGFSFTFIYGNYPDAFQYKLKFKADGWIIGFEGGSL